MLISQLGSGPRDRDGGALRHVHCELLFGVTLAPGQVLTLQTEQDFADIAKVGLNWVRIPLGFWAIETQAGEPYLEGVSWQ
jgi:beta-galactosidase GanA